MVSLGFLFVKLADIGLVTIYFFLGALFFAKVFDTVYGPFDKKEYDKMSMLNISLRIIVHLFLIGIVAYILRNAIEAIPFPLEGVSGFEHLRLKELEGGVVLHTVLFLFQENLRDKITYFAHRALNIKAQHTDLE